MVGMARMGRRRTSQGEKGELRRNHGFTDLRSYGITDLHGFFYLTQKPGRVSFKENQENPLASMLGFQPVAM